MSDMNMNTNDVTDTDKLWALLNMVFAPVAIVGIISLLMEDKKSRPFIKYYAVQGLVLAVLSYIGSLIICGGLLVWVYAIYVGFQAYKGEWVQIPVVTDFCKGQGWI